MRNKKHLKVGRKYYETYFCFAVCILDPKTLVNTLEYYERKQDEVLDEEGDEEEGLEYFLTNPPDFAHIGGCDEVKKALFEAVIMPV